MSDAAVAVCDDGDGEQRLVAYLVATGRPPTLIELRCTLWAVLPGVPWPTEAFVVGSLRRRPDGRVEPPTPGDGVPVEAEPDAGFQALTAILGGGRIGPQDSYWQEFSFFDVLTSAREAGLEVGDDDVARCRTPEMLATAIRARQAPAGES